MPLLLIWLLLFLHFIHVYTAAGDGVLLPAGDGVLLPAGDGVLLPAGDGVLLPAGDSILLPAGPIGDGVLSKDGFLARGGLL